jgi:hypothetical protein
LETECEELFAGGSAVDKDTPSIVRPAKTNALWNQLFIT